MPTSEQATQTTEADGSIAVEIYDQIYHLRGIDPTYIQRLADRVDSKMRAVSAHGGTVDSLRVAVLASLNIADELECLRERHAALAGSLTHSQHTVRSRSATLADMLDEVLNVGADEPALDQLENVQIRRAG